MNFDRKLFEEYIQSDVDHGDPPPGDTTPDWEDETDPQPYGITFTMSGVNSMPTPKQIIPYRELCAACHIPVDFIRTWIPHYNLFHAVCPQCGADNYWNPPLTSP